MYLLEWLKSKILAEPNAEHVEHRNFHLVLVGTQNGTATLEDSGAVSYTTKYILAI